MTKLKYQTKTVTFAGSNLTLYSLDGLTWSSKKDELTEIQERQERQKLALQGLKVDDDVAKDAKKEVVKPVIKDDIIIDDVELEDDEDDEEIIEEVEIEEDDDDEPKVKKGSVKKPAKKPEKKAPAKKPDKKKKK